MDNDSTEEFNDSNCELSKNEVIKLLFNQDTAIDLIAPKKFKSPIWERFRLVYYKGKFHILMINFHIFVRFDDFEFKSSNSDTEQRLLSRSVIRESRLYDEQSFIRCCE
jgi:hypothetical protein